LTDDHSDEEFAPIAAAMRELPSFEPSPGFADMVMARVNIAQSVHVPAVVEPRPVRQRSERLPSPAIYEAPRPAHYFPRSLPARIAAVALLGSLSVTMSVVALIAMFQLDLLVFVARLLGEGTIGFLASLSADAAGAAVGVASSSATAVGTGSGLAIAGSFVAGVVVAAAGLKAAAATSRKAA